MDLRKTNSQGEYLVASGVVIAGLTGLCGVISGPTAFRLKFRARNRQSTTPCNPVNPVNEPVEVKQTSGEEDGPYRNDWKDLSVNIGMRMNIALGESTIEQQLKLFSASAVRLSLPSGWIKWRLHFRPQPSPLVVDNTSLACLNANARPINGLGATVKTYRVSHSNCAETTNMEEL
jgi:hypothetical protein